jgi:hypothetical protein
MARKKNVTTTAVTRQPQYDRAAIMDYVCERLATSSLGLASILDAPGMPCYAAVTQWMRADPALREQYERAKEDQADFMADEIIKIIDELPQEIVDDKGSRRYDSAFVTWQKNRVDARKWCAAHLKPKRYSDRIDLNHSGEIKTSDLTDEQLDKRIAELTAKNRAD